MTPKRGVSFWLRNYSASSSLWESATRRRPARPGPARRDDTSACLTVQPGSIHRVKNGSGVTTRENEARCWHLANVALINVEWVRHFLRHHCRHQHSAPTVVVVISHSSRRYRIHYYCRMLTTDNWVCCKLLWPPRTSLIISPRTPYEGVL